MRIMIVTDAWAPQTNGVVNTLSQTALWLGRFGHEVSMLTPRDFKSIACPTYPEIRLSLLSRNAMRNRIPKFAPQALHIAIACGTACASRRPTTRNFPSICELDFRSRSRLLTGC